MAVITSARFYAFDLVPANGAPPYEVRFRYPNEPSGDASNMLGEMGDPVGEYRLSGTRALRPAGMHDDGVKRSEEHTSELQSLMRISYAVLCLKKKKQHNTNLYKSYLINEHTT